VYAYRYLHRAGKHHAPLTARALTHDTDHQRVEESDEGQWNDLDDDHPDPQVDREPVTRAERREARLNRVQAGRLGEVEGHVHDECEDVDEGDVEL